ESAENNPLATDEGVAQINHAVRATGVAVESLCADYFMEETLLRVAPHLIQQRIDHLCWLMRRARLVGIKRLVLPFVDSSRINSVEEASEVVRNLRPALGVAEESGMEIHLETSLAPRAFADLLERFAHPLVKVNYDSGNSASLGFDVEEEWTAYGRQVGSVHVK